LGGKMKINVNISKQELKEIKIDLLVGKLFTPKDASLKVLTRIVKGFRAQEVLCK
jgi:hypothetical protein